MMVFAGGLFLFAFTLVWGYLALAVASHGNDPVQLERCGGSLPYTFLNIVGGLGFLAGTLGWLTSIYANGSKHGRWFFGALVATTALFGLWTLAGGFTALSCAFD